VISRRSILGAGAGAGALALAGTTASTAWAFGGVPWCHLAAQLSGHLVLPGDTEYATAKNLYDQQFDTVSPRAVAYCASASDVSRSLVFAQRHHIPFAVRSGGHSLAGFSTSTGLVIDVSLLNSVSVGDGTVTIGSGAQGVDVTNALAPQGLAVVGGYHSTVAVGGFYQGGGYGLLSRTQGMGCDRLTSAEVVLAGGAVVTASPTQYRDLFWAIRGGGGGNFGVVTSFTMTPTVLPQIAVTNVVWSWDNAATVLDGYARWLVDAPRTVTGGLVVQLEDAAAGSTPLTYAFVASTSGNTTELESEVARLTSLTGAPVQQTPTAVVPLPGLLMNFYGCATGTPTQCHRADNHPGGTIPRPHLYLLRSRMFNSLPSLGMWQDVVRVFDARRAAGQTQAVELLPFGGAVGDLSRTDTAFVHRDALFSVSFRADISSEAADTPAGRVAAHGFVDDGFAVLDPRSAGETYQNFVDAKLTDWAHSYYGENLARLVRIKSKYDPSGAFRFAQSVA
jgi:FAD/FMN-containing dehydrogenase